MAYEQETRPRLDLQPLEAADSQHIVDWANHSDLAHMGIFAHIAAETEQRYERLSIGIPETLAIKSEGKLVGIVDLLPTDDWVKFSVWLDNRHRGEGIGSRVVNGLAVDLFGLGFSRMVAEVSVANNAAQAMLARTGFSRKGQLEISGSPFYIYSLSSTEQIVNMMRNL